MGIAAAHACGLAEDKKLTENPGTAGDNVPQEANLPEWSCAVLNLRRLGLSQSEFGSRLHYSAMAVSRWETGKQEPTSRCLIMLGNMAGQPDCWLFWSRAGLKSSDLQEMLPGPRAMARITKSQD
jgi:hypothetical protein